MRVLVTEEEPRVAAYLRRGFGESGFVLDVAENGADGLFLATTGDYDLIVLDVLLSQVDGWSILKSLRGAGKQVPVMFLTACDSVPDRVKGLDLGADDYLVKPFALSELLARVRSLLRRGQDRTAESLQIADLEIDFPRQRVLRGGQRIDLTAKEFALVSFLAQRTGEILSRMLIAEYVWDTNFGCDSNVVDVTVRRLRSKVDDPFAKKLIRSVRGRGYVLESR